MLYRRVDPVSGEPVNFVGVGPVGWHDHPEQPQAGFVETDWTLDEVLRLVGAAQDLRRAVDAWPSRNDTEKRLIEGLLYDADRALAPFDTDTE